MNICADILNNIDTDPGLLDTVTLKGTRFEELRMLFPDDDNPSEIDRNIWFQQDRATPYFSLEGIQPLLNFHRLVRTAANRYRQSQRYYSTEPIGSDLFFLLAVAQEEVIFFREFCFSDEAGMSETVRDVTKTTLYNKAECLELKNLKYSLHLGAKSGNSTLKNTTHGEDLIVTPFAQILASLRSVRNNFQCLTNVPSNKSTTDSPKQYDDTNLPNIKRRKLEYFGHIMRNEKIPPSSTHPTGENRGSKVSRTQTNIVAAKFTNMDRNDINSSIQSGNE
ncbi:hypothetical protein NQ318_017254 [Aromia moschata]|uniref:3',5'-cyclic-AMP phosphodiesterase n=1 Tax=Aromia moschata TaxID=1265417 RepID=A0AAV8YN78_9CUCU|nr:hypothetical protein NQ318_017254 [Aromia moschata]